jgi:hypothetical protein
MGNTMSNWYKWDSIESFDSWNDALGIELGLPKPSVDANGVVVPDGVENTTYTKPTVVAIDDVRALVQSQYADGLVPSETPYVYPYPS